MKCDFTYIDDIVEGVVRVLDKPATADEEWRREAPDPSSSSAPYRIFNIGNNNPVQLLDFIKAIENALGRTAIKEMMPIQPGDVEATCADIEDLADYVGYRPSTSVEQGVENFVQWYLDYTGSTSTS